MTGYVHRSLADLDPNPEKPARRYEVSPALGIEGYTLNVALLDPGERLAKSGLHYHEAQEEVVYVAAGRCRVELEDGSVDLDTDDAIRFSPGTPQFVHNPFDEPAKLVAIGHPADAHEPNVSLQSAADLLAERYGDERPDRGAR